MRTERPHVFNWVICISVFNVHLMPAGFVGQSRCKVDWINLLRAFYNLSHLLVGNPKHCKTLTHDYCLSHLLGFSFCTVKQSCSVTVQMLWWLLKITQSAHFIVLKYIRTGPKVIGPSYQWLWLNSQFLLSFQTIHTGTTILMVSSLVEKMF